MSNFKSLLQSGVGIIKRNSLLRGMLTYSITWPIGSLVQQTFDSDEYSISRTLKFGLYGSCYVAPTLYTWMRISCFIFPKTTLLQSITKGVIEQATYSPFAISSFFFVITLLEGGSIDDGVAEVNKKLIPTWKISAAVWPFFQTINYWLIPEKNRVPFIGSVSLCWTIFLAFIKYRQNVVNTGKEDTKDVIE